MQAGSLTVRVRSDSDDQMILAHLTNRLSNLVWPLTIQINKDERSLLQPNSTASMANQRLFGGSSVSSMGGAVPRATDHVHFAPHKIKNNLLATTPSVGPSPGRRLPPQAESMPNLGAFK